jgi:hypothetical protein
VIDLSKDDLPGGFNLLPRLSDAFESGSRVCLPAEYFAVREHLSADYDI